MLSPKVIEVAKQTKYEVYKCVYNDVEYYVVQAQGPDVGTVKIAVTPTGVAIVNIPKNKTWVYIPSSDHIYELFSAIHVPTEKSCRRVTQ